MHKIVALILISLAAWPAIAAEEPSTMARLEAIGQWDGHTETAILEGPYEDPSQQQIPFGQRSYYLAPWRAYMDTWPAAQYLECPGFNFNVNENEADAVAAVLAEAGFRSARIEVGWGSFQYDNPTQLTEPAARAFASKLAACKKHGLRPLVLLNANSGWPCPVRSLAVNLRQAAPAGAREIVVDRTEGIVPHRTGLRGQAYQIAFPLITRVDVESGRCELSAPLRKEVPAGRCELFTLKYRPFGGVTFEDGSPNSSAQETLEGWMQYVKAIAEFAREKMAAASAEVGKSPSDAGFDLEVWNEYTFGSQFLEEKNYYDPPREYKKPVSYANHGLVRLGHEIVLPMTVDFVNAPSNKLAGVRVISGFANQRPWDNGAEMWPGQAGFSRHYYTDLKLEGWDGRNGLLSPATEKKLDQPMVNALGQTEKAPFFIPTLRVAMPETWHYGYKTELITREVVPFPNPMRNHFRYGHPGDGRAAEVWMTEFNLWRQPWANQLMKATGADKNDPRLVKLMHEVGAKVLLRSTVFHSHKGIATINFYAARAPDTDFGILPSAFFAALKAANYQLTPEVRALAGEQVRVLRQVHELMRSGKPLAVTRALSVEKLVEHQPRLVFQGDGSAAHPDRFHRHDFACLPFQLDADRYAVGYYVVTRNVVHEWDQTKDRLDADRYRMPGQTFDLTLGNVRGEGAMVSVFDPVSEKTLEAPILSGTQTSLTVRLETVDYPRFLQIQESRPGPLIVAAKFAATADGDGELSFRLNQALPAKAWWGPWPERRLEGPLQFSKNAEHQVKLPLHGPNCGVYLEAQAAGLIASWPHWIHDTAGVVWTRRAPSEGVLLPEKAARLPALSDGPKPATFNVNLPDGLKFSGTPPSLELGEGETAILVTLRQEMVREDRLAGLFPQVTALDEAVIEPAEWSGAPAWKADYRWSEAARPGLKQDRLLVFVAPLRAGYLRLEFQGTDAGFQRWAQRIRQIAAAVSFPKP